MKKNTIKKLIAYVLSISLLTLSFTACTNSSSNQVKLQDFPETLTIECEIPEEYPETVSVYHIDNFDDFNVDVIPDIFFGKEEYEYLDLEESCIYITESELYFHYITISQLEQWPVGISTGMLFLDEGYYYNYNNLENYVSRGGYESVEEAIDDFKYILNEVLTDLDYRPYLEEVNENAYGDGVFLKTTAELLIFRQYIDDIPIGVVDEYNKNYLGLFYTQVYYTLTDGLLNMGCNGPKVADEELYSSEIISPNIVINTLIDIHNNSLIDNYETIIEVELQYTVRYNDVSGASSDKENLMIYPIWSIKTSQTTDPEDTSLYSYYGFDAITGELWVD